MKKLRLTALILCAGLALSGCGSMLDRSYSSHTAHVDYSITEDSSILRAESYQALLNSILYYVNEHAAGGTIRLYNYTGDVDADLQRACDEVINEDPLGAYAVNAIDYDSTRILTYYEVTLRITYRRTADQLVGIRTVSGQDGIRQELNRMISNRISHTVLRTSYFTGDEQFVATLFRLSLYSNPVVASVGPGAAISFYPKEGSQRILELDIQWPDEDYDPGQYRQALDEAAALLLEDAPPTGETYTVEALAEALHSVLNYAPGGSNTALAALQGEPVNDVGSLLAMEYLCQLYSIEVLPVTDSAQMWLVVATPSGYRHLLPRDLRPNAADPDPGESADPSDSAVPELPAEPTLWQLPLYTDEELMTMGFTWLEDLCPACVDYSGALPE